MARRVLVTGGAGFIGSHVVEQLVANGDEVEVLDDLSRGQRDWLPPDVRIHEADVRDMGALEQAVDAARAEVVVHLAALHYIPAVDDAPELARQINVQGTKTLLTVLARCRPAVLLFASTAAVYPDRSGPISESCAVAPLDVYGETKAVGEELVAQFEASSGVRCVIARLFNVIGMRETNPHVVPDLVGQLRRGATCVYLGNLNAVRDYTDAVDVADALVRLLERDLAHSIFNVGSGQGTSVAELVTVCERILGRRLNVSVESTRLRKTDRHELIADVHLLRETTGWSQSRSLEQTLARLLLD